MSKKKPSNQGIAKPSKSTTAQAGRAAKIAAIKREEQMKKRVTIAIVGVVALVVLGVVIALVANALRTPTTDPSGSTTTTTSTSAPTGTSTQGETPTGSATSPWTFTYGTGKVEVDVYFDFMCPGCGGFERTNGEDLKELAANNTITLRLHPMSFLDRMSRGTQYSTRAANAFIAVADQAPDKAQDFAALLWENQPEENTEGISNEQIAEYAREVGVPDAIIATFDSLSYAAWVEESTQASLADGVELTPGFVVNGEWILGKQGQATTWNVGTAGVVKSELEKLANG